MTTTAGPGAEPVGGQRILVVDDAPDTRMILNLRLQREGYVVFTADGGRAALDIIPVSYTHLTLPTSDLV